MQTKAKVMEIDLIGAVYAAVPMEYIAVLTMEESGRGDDLEHEHLKEVMGKMWKHSGGKPGNEPVKTEIVLNVFTGYFYTCKEKGHRATRCPSKEVKKTESGGTGRRFNGNCNQCGHQGHKKVSVGKCQRMRTRDLPDINRKPSIDMQQLAVVQEKNLYCAL